MGGPLERASDFSRHGLGVRGLVDRRLPAPGSPRGYAPSVFVDALVLLLQAGGRHLEDRRALERESALLTLVGGDPVPDPDTGGDGLRRMGDPPTGQAGLVGLGVVRDTLTARRLKRDAVSESTVDAAALQVEGEKRDAPWTDQGVHGDLPMRGVLFEPGLCLRDECREGPVPPHAGHRALSPQCRQAGAAGQAERAVPGGQRVLPGGSDQRRGDGPGVGGDHGGSGCRGEAARPALPEPAWTEPVVGCGDPVAETVHTMTHTRRAGRLILKRWLKPPPALLDDPGEPSADHAVASNGPEAATATAAGLAGHNQRGQAEHFNKALTRGFGLEQLPGGQCGAHAVFVRLGVLAYNLFIGFKRLACPEAWARHTIATVRWNLIHIAGRIVRHAGQVVLRLGADADLLALGHGIRARGWAVSQAI